MSKKWLVIVADEQYDWIKKTESETGVKGRTILQEAIERARTRDSGDFKASLMEAQVKGQLEKIAQEEADLQQRKQALRSRLKGAKITA